MKARSDNLLLSWVLKVQWNSERSECRFELKRVFSPLHVVNRERQSRGGTRGLGGLPSGTVTAGTSRIADISCEMPERVESAAPLPRTRRRQHLLLKHSTRQLPRHPGSSPASMPILWMPNSSTSLTDSAGRSPLLV